MIAVMQRLHEEDPAALLLELGWQSVCIPAIADRDGDFILHDKTVHHRKKGDLLDPVREPLWILEELKKSSAYVFAAQYQQSPIPEGGGLLKWEWLPTCSSMPSRHQFEFVLQSWDTATDPGLGNDYSACITIGRYRGKLYLMDVYRARLEFPELLEAVVHRARIFDADGVLIEAIGAGKSLAQQLRHEGALFPFITTPKESKKDRAIKETIKFQRGLLVRPASAPGLDDLKSEFCGFPAGKYDDQVDALVHLLRGFDFMVGEIKNWPERWKVRKAGNERRPQELHSRVRTFG